MKCVRAVPEGVVTSTGTVEGPAAVASEVNVRNVSVLDNSGTGDPLNITVAPESQVPVIVSCVPPAVGPWFGEMIEMTGAAAVTFTVAMAALAVGEDAVIVVVPPMMPLTVNVAVDIAPMIVTFIGTVAMPGLDDASVMIVFVTGIGVIVTVIWAKPPGATGRGFGESVSVDAGAVVYVNPPGTTNWPHVPVSETVTVPTACAGAGTVTVVFVMLGGIDGTPPKSTPPTHGTKLVP